MAQMYTPIRDLDEFDSSDVTSTHFEMDRSSDQKSLLVHKLLRQRLPLLIGGILSLVLVLVIYWSNSSVVSLSGTAECRECNFRECKRTLCDHAIAPFVCISGAANDGCASTSNAWIGNSVCDECCDSSNCVATELAAEDDSISLCPACSAQECQTFSSKCDVKDPYMCLEGGARYGCSADKYHWPTALNGICTQCCDLTKCY
jgi:hypothetical protein